MLPTSNRWEVIYNSLIRQWWNRSGMHLLGQAGVKDVGWKLKGGYYWGWNWGWEDVGGVWKGVRRQTRVMGCMSCHFGKGEGCVSKVQDTSTVCERTMVIKFYKSTPIHTFGAIWSERCLVSEDYVSPDVGEWLAVISGVVRCSLLPSSPPLPILLKCIVHILFIAPGSQPGAPEKSA